MQSALHTPPAAEFQWVDQTERLQAVAALFPSGSSLAIDTEADSLHHYHERVCLIQISFQQRHYLVDPLCGMPLEPLWQCLGNTRWIIHSADYDLRMLRAAGAPEPVSVFDTMLAAQLLGFQFLGYAALVAHYFDVAICKKNQRADWSQRPLSPSMLAYAVEDTRYLHTLMERLTELLESKGRLGWHTESCERLVRATRRIREYDSESAWQIPGHAKLSPMARAILRALWNWREMEAEKADRPPFKIIPNETLIHISAMAEAQPQQISDGHLRLPRHFYGERRTRFFAAITQGQAAEPVPLTKYPRRRVPGLDITQRVEELKKHRDQLALELEMDPTVIASKTILQEIALDSENAPRRLISEDRWSNWQAQLLGV